jgi:hypothetical protein
MSLTPAPMAMGAAFAPPAIINPIEQVFLAFNTNPYFIGLMMLLLNLGGRFIGMEISKEQERIFQHPWVRRALIFTVLFVATRNIFVALIMTFLVLLLLSFLLNENSDLCLWKRDTGKPKVSASADTPPSMTPEETEIWRRLHEKQTRIAAALETKKKESDSEEQPQDMTLDEIYAVNLAKFQ